MNILHIISGGEVGGSKKHLLALAQNMKARGHKNIVICLIKGKLYEEALEKGLDARLVKQESRFDLSVISRIAAICKDEGIEIINAHGGRANFLCWFLKKRVKLKFATTVHSDYRDDYRGNRYKTLVYSNLNRIALKAFDRYITVSDSFKEMLVDRGFIEDKISVVYNGIDFNKKLEGFEKDRIIDKYGLPERKHYVSMIGRFHPVKGHRVFLDACKIILEKFQDVEFILVGDGDLKDELKEYTISIGIEKHVYFAGFQLPDEFIYISDFTVMASYTESFPLTILESAMYEKTVVSTEVGGIPKLVENGHNGWLVPAGDSSLMAGRMLEMLEDERKCMEFGCRLNIKAKDNYSVENMTDSYIDIYKRLLTGGTGNEKGNLSRC